MSLVSNERIELSASDRNTVAGGLFTAGVVAPLVAVVFGWGVAFLALRAGRTDP